MKDTLISAEKLLDWHKKWDGPKASDKIARHESLERYIKDGLLSPFASAGEIQLGKTRVNVVGVDIYPFLKDVIVDRFVMYEFGTYAIVKQGYADYMVPINSLEIIEEEQKNEI